MALDVDQQNERLLPCPLLISVHPLVQSTPLFLQQLSLWLLCMKFSVSLAAVLCDLPSDTSISSWVKVSKGPAVLYTDDQSWLLAKRSIFFFFFFLAGKVQHTSCSLLGDLVLAILIQRLLMKYFKKLKCSSMGSFELLEGKGLLIFVSHLQHQSYCPVHNEFHMLSFTYL